MRPRYNSPLSGSLFGSLLGFVVASTACDWREFDTIADDTWVTTTAAPTGVDSNDFALGLAEANNEAATPAETKQLAVISRSRLTLAFFAYDADGNLSNRQTISLDANSGGPFDALPPSPIYASDPTSGRVAIANNGKVAIADPSRSNLEVATLPSSSKSAGLTFFSLDTVTYIAAASESGIAVINAAMPTTVISCSQVAGTPTVDVIGRVVALGTVRTTDAEGLVVWYENKAMPATVRVAAFGVEISSACTLTRFGDASAEVSVPVRPDYPLIEGARIVTIPGSEAVAISDPLKGVVSIYKPASPSTITSFMAPDIAALTAGTIGADTYLFSGSPNQDIEGTSNAGRVQVTKLTGIAAAAAPSLTLYDASPDTEQRFGRSIAVIPFGDATSPIVVVGADDEMFSYFRTELYGERRAQ
jgi:hypothetical protein